MWGKERTSLALRRMTNPAAPHKLKGVTGLEHAGCVIPRRGVFTTRRRRERSKLATTARLDGLLDGFWNRRGG